VFEICEQLELALEYIASENNISISAAFELFQNGFTAFLGGPACNISGAEEECDTGIGLLECLEERLLPILERANYDNRKWTTTISTNRRFTYNNSRNRRFVCISKDSKVKGTMVRIISIRE
jgi:hypothetical protein